MRLNATCNARSSVHFAISLKSGLSWTAARAPGGGRRTPHAEPFGERLQRSHDILSGPRERADPAVRRTERARHAGVGEEGNGGLRPHEEQVAVPAKVSNAASTG